MDNIYYTMMRFVLAGLGSFSGTILIAFFLFLPIISEYQQPNEVTFEGTVLKHDIKNKVLVIETRSDNLTPYHLVQISYDDGTSWSTALRDVQAGTFLAYTYSRIENTEQDLSGEFVAVSVMVSNTLTFTALNIIDIETAFL